MDRTQVALGALSGFLAVAAGAFGAHALKGRLTPDLLSVFETGARYHLSHALALVLAGLAGAALPGPWTRAAGWLFLAGTAVFSGSLYALALSGVRTWGAVTPFGGLLLLLGWLSLAVGAWRG